MGRCVLGWGSGAELRGGLLGCWDGKKGSWAAGCAMVSHGIGWVGVWVGCVEILASRVGRVGE